MAGVFEDCRQRHTVGSSTAVGDYPATVNAGDILLVWATSGNDSVTATNPTGYGAPVQEQQNASNGTAYLWSKVADGTEGGGTLNISLSGSTNYNVAIARVSASSGIDVSQEYGAFQFNSATHDSPSVTTTADDELCIIFFFQTKGGGEAWGGVRPSGTSAAPNQHTNDVNFNQISSVAQFTQATAGATGTKQWTSLRTIESQYSVVVAFSNAGGGGDPVPLMAQACF